MPGIMAREISLRYFLSLLLINVDISSGGNWPNVTTGMLPLEAAHTPSNIVQCKQCMKKVHRWDHLGTRTNGGYGIR